MEKKDSIFAGLNPSPAPAPAPMPAPRPSVPDQEVADLKRKIEAMEKNIVSQLEKKIGETFKTAAAPMSPPPPLPPAALRQPEMNAQFLLARIAELDKRLEEFGRSTMASSAQMKNIEESKISARREIEDLLKVVREQQKYSEMDRQIHDQLEKSWHRVEELEKKLMEFYGAVLNSQQRKDDVDAALSRELGARMDALVTRFDQEARSLESRLHPFSGLKEELMAGLAATREETLSLVREQAASFKAMLDEKVKDRLELMRSSVSEELERLSGSMARELERNRRETAAQMEFFKKELSGYMAAMETSIEDFRRVAGENRIRAEGLESAIARNTSGHAAMLQQNFEEMSEAFAREGGRFMAELEKRNRACFEALNTKYADALSNAAILDSAYSSAEASAAALKEFEGTMSALLKQVPKDRLDALLGVSGLLFRKNFDELERTLPRIKAEAAAFERIKKDIKDRIDGAFGGEGKSS